MSQSWYVLQSKPNKEDFLFSQLQQRDIEVYYPRLRVEPVNPRSRKVRPFFPGYLFVNVDLEQTPLSSIAYVPGINRVVSFDQKPAIVPDEIIQAIIQNVERINENPDMQYNQLQPGDPVTIQNGPFEGYEAIFDTRLKGSERIRLLVKLLQGQQIRVQVDKKMVKPKN